MAISDRIDSIEQHLKESYQELQGIGIDTSEVNNNLENIPKLLDGYWETLPKVTDEGTSITLDNTKEGKMGIIYKGNTYQYSTTGKQLYDVNDILSFDNIVNVDDNDWITISYNNSGGSSTKWFDFKTKPSNNIVAGTTYKLVIEVKSVTGTGSINFVMNQPIGQVNITISSSFSSLSVGTKVYDIPMKSDFTGCTSFLNSYGRFVAGESGSITFRMSVIADTSVTPSTFVYEPYTNGASPNPDYPQDIQVVSGDNSIVVCGKNLLDTSSMVMGDLQNDTGAEIVNNNHTHYRSGFIKVLPSTQYTFTTNYTYPRNSVTKLMEYNNDKTFIQRSPSSSPNKTITFTTTSTTQYLRICMYSYSAFTDFYSLENMLCKGNNTTYEAYTGATYLVNLGTMELCKIGDYQDRIFKNTPNSTYYDSNLEDNVWYLNKQIGKVVLNGSENWSINGTGTSNWFYNTNGISNGSETESIRSLLKSNNYSYSQVFSSNTNQGIWYSKTSIRIRYGTEDTINNFKTWLSTHNTTVYYVLENPTITEIEGTLKEQLEAIKTSYEGQTNISQENNDLVSVLNASALQEM